MSNGQDKEIGNQTKEKCPKCHTGKLLRNLLGNEWCTKCNYYKRNGKLVYIPFDVANERHFDNRSYHQKRNYDVKYNGVKRHYV